LNGLVAVNNTTLLSVITGVTSQSVAIIDVSTNTGTPFGLFDLPSDRRISNDLIYTTEDKIIVSQYKTSDPTQNYLVQYDFQGNVEVEISLDTKTSNIFSVPIHRNRFN
jgi:hypothetical protein